MSQSRVQRAEFGGISVAAISFGWLVSVALPVLLTAVTGLLAAAAGMSLDLTREDAREQAQGIGVAAGLLLLVFVLLGYFGGGYVAGRMTRFDAGRQGIGVWVLGLLVGMGASATGATLGVRHDVVDVPASGVPETALGARAAFAIAVLLLTTLLVAFLGARSGQRYHARAVGRPAEEPRV